ncbi:ClpXP protease specificity-enhancing factor SspB [Ancylobacter pratisalsi]|uniref:Stringent starvation protein B n=1 Tax=Ancylobacter pratisalsi TaxID=1745854 RepID=A0A6P1YMF7_9HYPH|nr:hypothetical protein G3A50_06595 [Ancylobacter pratisalsi]
MSVDLIRYDLLVQDALRAVVRRVLTDVAQDGLPGDHHLYVSFDTCAPGVRLSARLKEKYPEEMTIVLQHQFWDLIVTESFFEVGLSFNGIPEKLHVPFSSLKGFFDPSVKFGLQFEPTPTEETEAELPEPAPVVTRPTSVPTTRGPSQAARADAKPARLESVPKSSGKTASETSGNAKVGGAAKPGASGRPEPVSTASSAKREADEGVNAAKAGNDKTDAARARIRDGEEAKGASKAGEGTPADEAPTENAPSTQSGAQVVRLDAFRKK